MRAQALELLTVRVGGLREVRAPGHTARSGVDKRPQTGAVRVGREGLAGDRIGNPRFHGGPDQAVYLFSEEDALAWAERGGEGEHVGENLRVRGVGWALNSGELRVGDRLRFGEVRLEVTAARLPCAVAGSFFAGAGQADWVARFRALRRPGAYLRVLQAGEVWAGMAGEYRPGPSAAPTLGELMALRYGAAVAPERLRAWLEHPLSQRLRVDLERRLQETG